MSLLKRTANNSIAGFISFVWPIALYLAATPYIVFKLGKDEFGILSLVTVVLGFFALLDMGFSSASMKYVSEYHAKKDLQTTNHIVRVSISVYLVMGVIGALAIALLTNTIVTRILRIPAELVNVARFAFYVASFGFVANTMTIVFSSIPKALQRYDISTKISILVSTGTILLTVIALHFGYRLREVVIVNLSMSLVGVFCFVVVSKRLMPGLSLALSFERTAFKRLFFFGGYSFINEICGKAWFQFDRLIIGAMMGTSYVTYYVVPATLATRIHGLVSSITNVLFPLSSDLVATNQMARLKQVYLRATKYTLVLSTAISLPLFALSHTILSLWMGAEFAKNSSYVMSLLALSYCLVSMAVIPYYFFNGLNKPQVNAFYGVINGVANVTSCLLLVPRLGLKGAAISSLIGIASLPAFIYHITRAMDLNMRELLRTIYLKIIAAGAAELIITRLLSNVITSLPSLLLLYPVCVISFVLVLYGLRYFDEEDRIILRRLRQTA